MTLIAFVLPLVAGWCFLHAWLPLRQAGPRWASLLLELALGAGLGIGAASAGYVLLLVLGAGSAGAALALEVVLCGAGAGLLYFRRDRTEPEPAPRPGSFRWNWTLVVAAALTLAFLTAGLAAASSALPHGYWDAWSIWNVRAKYLSGDGEAWRAAVSPALRLSHPEYPLLLSGYIGMVWKIGGETPQWTPKATAFLSWFSTLGLLAGAIGWMRRASSALLAIVVFAASSSYAFLVAWQYADAPLGFYFAATLALAAMASSEERLAPRARLLAGAFASFAAWTKNEGVAFAGAVLLCYLAAEWRSQGLKRALPGWGAVVLGSAPILVLLACFKFFIAAKAAGEPFLAQGGAAILQKIADPARYVLIARSLAVTAWEFGQPWAHPILLLAILAFGLRFTRERRFRPGIAISAGTLAVMFLVYCGVYLITPADLAWHLSTSLSRLYVQLWPPCVLLAFLALRTIEDSATGPLPDPPAGKVAGRPAPGRRPR